ncbi:hypothetical protein NDI76_16210 [Halogeometricum sp. S1BR25-6]|uniref:Concanavalin A-like lectin/glucanases superfamily protein n=1 Tax=Halogeometricum salsisoli TaxID=2950536 RepID=A0ABU2GIR0_9EURY|nr:hypothetical protein [Halogeometricum sp. S1BR25-6]MDS0300291.1 hypothetical protein [Halogeometricum sp. S1BR25-6]
MTSNHGYNTPAEGTVDWHVPLNENFHKIDTGVEIRDTEESLDQYTPKGGAKFLATDTGVRYLGDGSEWKEAPVHLPALLEAPTYSSTNPSETSVGELWYRSDLDALVVQSKLGVVNVLTGAIIEDANTESESNSSTDETHTLSVEAVDGASWDRYRAVIDGEIIDTQNINTGDSITPQPDGTVLIEGGIRGGATPEVFTFRGTLTSLSLTVEGTAYLDGQPIDPTDY